MPPILPSVVWNAIMVKSAPEISLPASSTEPRTPVDAIARPVMEQTIIVSINVPHIFM